MSFFTSKLAILLATVFKIKKQIIKKCGLYAVFILATLSVQSEMVSAKPLNDDPAWQSSKLDNGFVWQLLTASHRPTDPIELRLVIHGSVLQESAEQKGAIAQLIKLGFTQTPFTASQLSQWAPKINDKSEPIVTIGYDQITLSLSIPNDKLDLLKSAIEWLGGMASPNIDTPQQSNQSQFEEFSHLIATKPSNPQDAFWRHRLIDSIMLGVVLDSNLPALDKSNLQAYKENWFTPDAMQLYVVGKIESRVLNETINRAFGAMSGKREKAAKVAVLQPLKPGGLIVPDDMIQQPILSIYTDSSWYPITKTEDLIRYWRMELAREAIYQRVSPDFNKSNKHQLGFECNVAYQRQLCGFNVTDSTNKFDSSLGKIAKILSNLREKGISDAELKALIEAKNKELAGLFAIYAKTDLRTLINNRLQSQNNGVVDLALEDYQILRTEFLSSINLDVINDDIEYLISQPVTLIIRQPSGSDELDVQSLLATYQNIVYPKQEEPEQELDVTPEILPVNTMPSETSLNKD